MNISKKGKKPYQIRITSKALKDLEKIKDPDFEKIQTIIEDLHYNPRPQRCKKLKKSSLPSYRIRQGNWRKIYNIYDQEQLVVIARVRRRNEETYK